MRRILALMLLAGTAAPALAAGDPGDSDRQSRREARQQAREEARAERSNSGNGQQGPAPVARSTRSGGETASSRRSGSSRRGSDGGGDRRVSRGRFSGGEQPAVQIESGGGENSGERRVSRASRGRFDGGEQPAIQPIARDKVALGAGPNPARAGPRPARDRSTAGRDRRPCRSDPAPVRAARAAVFRNRGADRQQHAARRDPAAAPQSNAAGGDRTGGQQPLAQGPPLRLARASPPAPLAVPPRLLLRSVRLGLPAVFRSAGGCGRAITAAVTGSTTRGSTGCLTLRRAIAGSAIMTTRSWSTRGTARSST